ncbi:MAG: DUF4129 domain-containing protein [Pseudonocardiales bacterium]|nr:MAG: DUF4129 domain-containing protein [Pseudonocardiales bacterium]
MSSHALLRAWPLLAAAVLLGVVALAAAGGAGARVGTHTIGTYVVDPGCAVTGAGRRPSCRPSPQPSAKSTGRAPAAPALVGLFSGFGILVTVALVLVVVAVLVAVTTAAGSIAIRRRARYEAEGRGDGEPGEASSIETARRLGAAAEAGLADLDDGTDPRRAVIAAWLRLEQAAASAGIPRRPAETPGELAERLLAAHAVSPVTLAGLAGLYREARYSRHPVDERMRSDARRALERLRRELTVAVSG